MPEQIKALGWRKGLNTAVAPAFIDQEEVADGSNFIVRDGTVRLDRRYIAKADPGTASPQGSGWGKYGLTGATLTQQYVAVNGGKLFEYDLTKASPSWVQAASGMAAGDWFWQQFGSYLYGVNSTAGLGRKLLGPGTNGHGDWAIITPPAAPANAPTATQNFSSNTQESFANSTFSSALGGALSHTYNSGSDSWSVNYTSAQTGSQSFTITFSTSPDRRPNWQYHDHLIFRMFLTTGVTRPDVSVQSTTNAGGTQAAPWRMDSVGPSSYYDCAYNINNISRANRVQVTTLTFTFIIPSNGASIIVYSPRGCGVWLTLDESTTVPFGTFPTLRPLQYEYTYVNTGLGLESPPSPQVLITAAQQNTYGEWRTVTCASTGASGVDKVRIYRRVEEGGAITRYLLAEVPNSGTPSFVDMLALDEVKALHVFTPSIIPSTPLTAISSWLHRLVVAAGNTVFISRDSDPLSFTDGTTIFDPSDESRAFTTPIDDRNAENVLGLATEGALYIITDYSVRYLFGTIPDNWRLNKIPNSEGACGPRAWASYKGGVLVLTPSGRLLFCTAWGGLSLWREDAPGNEPSEASVKLRARIGNSGIKAYATSDATVTVWPSGEIEVRNSTGYAIQDVDGNWRKGVHAESTHSTLSVSGLPRRWMGATTGKLLEGDSDAYITDGGTTGTNGAPVTGYIVTRDDRMARSRVTNAFIDSTQTLDPVSGLVLYPKITPITKRTTSEGLLSYVSIAGKKNTPRFDMGCTGEEFQHRIDFDANSVINEIRVSYEQESSADHL